MADACIGPLDLWARESSVGGDRMRVERPARRKAPRTAKLDGRRRRRWFRDGFARMFKLSHDGRRIRRRDG